MPLYRSSSGSSIGGSILGGTAGRIVYESTGPILADSANLQYSTAGNLGLSITPTVGFHQLGGDMRLQALATASAPTVTVNSGSGTNYYYYIVSEDRNGYRTVPSAASTVASSSATPNNTITWASVAGSVKYYVLRHTAGTLPAAPSTGNYLVGTWTSGALSVTDTSAAGTSFTTNSRNATADLIVDGAISCPGAGTASEHFGALSSSTGNYSLAVGNLSASTGISSLAVGYGSTVSGLEGVAVGKSVSAGAASTAIGATASCGDHSTAIGYGSGSSNTGSISIGRGATPNASKQCVIGGTIYPITTLYIGGGISRTSAGEAVTITSSSGATGSSDIPGNNITIAGGNSTGTGAGGYIKFQTAPAALGTGTALNTLTDRVLIDQKGNVVLAASGAALATDAVNGFSYIPTCEGVPTGVPAYLPTGAAPIVYNTTDNRLCVYNPTGTPAWKFITLGA